MKKQIISLGLVLSLLFTTTAEAVERLVVTFPLSFGLVYIMGLSDKVVGIPTQKLHLKKGDLGPFYSHYSPNLASATDIGFTGAINVETVLSLQPDLIISSETFSSDKNSTAFFRSNGIKVLEVKAGMGSVSDWLEVVKKACNDADRKEKGEAYIKLWERNLALVNERLAKFQKTNE